MKENHIRKVRKSEERKVKNIGKNIGLDLGLPWHYLTYALLEPVAEYFNILVKSKLARWNNKYHCFFFFFTKLIKF